MKLINIKSQKSRIAYTAVLATAALSLTTACNSLDDDDHYADSNSVINNPELKIVKQNSEQYIASRSDFSEMSALFKSYGIYDELDSKGQLSTILMVANDDMAGVRAEDDEKTEYIVRSHISDISVSPSNLHNGDRLMMWHGKFVNITMDEEGLKGAIIDHVKFNNAYVKEVIQTSNGYIYVISDMINTPTSLFDYINELPEEYSIFKNLVLASGGKEFDRANSKPIGVNSEGNTVYDSVFITTNAHFDAVNVDLNSEALTATMILPSNAVVKEAIDDAHRRLAMWGMERDDNVLYNWILDAAFFNKRYNVEDLVNTEAKLVKSVFNMQWRTDAHQLDAEGSEELSNGIVHKATRIHIPNNVLMYRLKSHFYLYEYCDDVQKASYFNMSNMKFSSVNDQNSAFTPLAALWPAVPYRCLILGVGDDGAASSFRLDFTPIRRITNEDGISVVEPFLIPPGAYKLTFGSEQNCGLTITASVLVNGTVVAEGSSITLGSATTYHYDRGAGGYPEGYDANVVTELGGSKASNYDRDGGPLIDSVVIPDVNGDGSAVPVVIRFEGASWLDKTKFIFHSWCMKPTADNY